MYKRIILGLLLTVAGGCDSTPKDSESESVSSCDALSVFSDIDGHVEIAIVGDNLQIELILEDTSSMEGIEWTVASEDGTLMLLMPSRYVPRVEFGPARSGEFGIQGKVIDSQGNVHAFACSARIEVLSQE